jgi:hypothetical protein
LPAIILLIQQKPLLRRKPEYLTLTTATAIAHVVRTRSKTFRGMQSKTGFPKTVGWTAIAKAYSHLLQIIARQVCVWETAEILVAIAGRH